MDKERKGENGREIDMDGGKEGKGYESKERRGVEG